MKFPASIVAAALLLAGSLASSNPACALSTVTLGSPYKISVSTVSFPRVGLGESLTDTVMLTNNSTSAITLTSINTAADFTVTAPTTTLGAKQSLPLTITFAPTVTGALAESVTIVVTDASSNATSLALTLKGTGTASFALSDPRLAFGNQGQGYPSAAKSVTFYNYGPSTTLSLPASVGPFLINAGSCVSAVAPYNDCSFSVTFQPSALGAATQTLTVQSGLSTQNIVLTGNGVAPFVLSPAVLLEGTVNVGSVSAVKHVTLTNHSGAAVTPVFANSNASFSVDSSNCATLASNASCAIAVTFAPTTKGNASSTLTVQAASNTLTATLSGTGAFTTLPTADSSPAAEPTAPAYPTTDYAGNAITPIVEDYLNQINAASSNFAAKPGVQVLNRYLDLFTPGSTNSLGTTWYAGTILNNNVLAYNNQYVVNLTTARTAAQKSAAYMDDRRNQSYSILDGLGPLTSYYMTGAGDYTTIPALDSTTANTEYDDASSVNNYAGSLTSSLGSVENLIWSIRSASTTPPKKFYNYPRPLRVNTSGVVECVGNALETPQTAGSSVYDCPQTTPMTVNVINGTTTSTSSRSWGEYASSDVVAPSLLVVRSTNPSSDQAFPSGHTNAAYMAGLAVAYAIPERFQEMLTRISELGSNRIMAGMHSPLDVMGGRMMGTAWAAVVLNANLNLNTASGSAPYTASSYASANKAGAYTQAHTYLPTVIGSSDINGFAHSATTATDRFADWATNKTNYVSRLTYGFTPIESTTQAMRVPEGAEVLLETRLPYLSANQRRWALYTTGIASGYPLLDDAEGWGRLNLFSAADGYGALNGNVIVNMDATQGGFNAADTWRNDITGSGKLFKQGTGSLTLGGNNAYTGGTQIDGGTLVATSASALGTGNVVLNGGTLSVNSAATVNVGWNLSVPSASTLSLNVNSLTQAPLAVAGIAGLNGSLQITFPSGVAPVKGKIYTLLTYGSHQGSFSSVNVNGTSLNYTLTYGLKSLTVKFTTTPVIP